MGAWGSFFWGSPQSFFKARLRMPPLDTIPHFSMIIIRQKALRVSGDLAIPAALSGRIESPAANPLCQQVQTSSIWDWVGTAEGSLSAGPCTLSPPYSGSCSFSNGSHHF